VMCQSSPADVLGCRAASRESVVPGMCRAQIGCAVIDSSASRPANGGDQVREHAIRSVIELGIDGLVLTSSPVCDLLAGIRALSRGSHYLCEPAAQLLDQMPEHEALTEREDDVLRLLARGLCDKSIACDLGIAVGTVKAHVKSIMSKLGPSCRTEAASIATQRGIVELPTSSSSRVRPRQYADWLSYGPRRSGFA
jgi:DNA-binding CsgD family transcriptional regulator